MSMPASPLSPYLHALQAYWRNYQWMLSFFRQSSKDKVSSFYPFFKSILGLTAKSHKITSNTTTYSKNLYYGYISLNHYQWCFGRKWFKCYLLRHQLVSTSPQFFFTCQAEAWPSLPVFGFWLLRPGGGDKYDVFGKLNGCSKCKQADRNFCVVFHAQSASKILIFLLSWRLWYILRLIIWINESLSGCDQWRRCNIGKNTKH